MLFKVFALYDSGISTWLPPIYLRNTGEAIRQVTDGVNNPDSKLHKYPGDYTLFEIGTWDDDKCNFDLLKAPHKVGTAIEFKKVVPTPSSEG